MVYVKGVNRPFKQAFETFYAQKLKPDRFYQKTEEITLHKD